MPTLALVVSLPAECSDANDQIKSGTDFDQVPIIDFFSYTMLTLMLAVGCWVSASVEAAEVSPVQSFVSVCVHNDLSGGVTNSSIFLITAPGHPRTSSKRQINRSHLCIERVHLSLNMGRRCSKRTIHLHKRRSR